MTNQKIHIGFKQNRILGITILLLLFLLAPTRFFTLGFFNWEYDQISYGGSLISLSTVSIFLFSPFLLVHAFERGSISKNDLIKWFLFVIFFFIVPVFCSIFSESYLLNSSLSEIIYSFSSPLLYSFFAYLICINISKSVLNTTIIFGFLILSLYSIIGFSGQGYQNQNRAGSLGLSPNEIAVIGTSLFVYALAIINKKFIFHSFQIRFNHIDNLLGILFLFVGTLAVFYSASRRALFIILFLLAFKLLFSRKFLLLFIYFISLLLLIFYLTDFQLPVFVNNPMFSRILFLDVNSDSIADDGRGDIWLTALLDFKTHFYYVRSLGQVAFETWKFETMHAHNFLLQIFLQYGLFLGGFLVIFLTYKLVSCLSLYVKDSKGKSFGLIFNYIFILLVISFSLFDWFFYNPKFLFITFLCYFSFINELHSHSFTSK